MKKIINETRDDERAYYGSSSVYFENISIMGPQDGESAFKESMDIEINKSIFLLRYPFWHVHGLKINECSMEDTCRAPLWYSKDIEINNTNCCGVKAVRECEDVKILNSTFESEEFGWRTNTIELSDSKVTGFYAFMMSKDIKLNNVVFKGKYSFQYTNNIHIKDSLLDTKDAFWHAKNVVVEDSTIIGEYLGWYSENIAFINCFIKGTQPLCYAKNVTIINCTFENADLAFEYSEINGNITGTLISIKNPIKGKLIVDKIPQMIIDSNDRSNGQFIISERE